MSLGDRTIIALRGMVITDRYAQNTGHRTLMTQVDKLDSV